MTQAEARQILHDRYWVASGADRLPKALAAVHGDTAINMGVGAANELLAQSGGDTRKYLSLRDARYRDAAREYRQAAHLASLEPTLVRKARLIGVAPAAVGPVLRRVQLRREARLGLGASHIR